MAALARSFALPDSVQERLAAVTASAVDVISGVDCADVLYLDKGRFVSVASTVKLPEALDGLQQQLGQGPCMDAARSQRIVRCDDLRIDTRWPLFARAAVESGVHSMLSLKLYVGEDVIGALNLFGFAPRAFDSKDEDIGAMFATHAAIALLGAVRSQQFRTALESRDVIGQAKGVIMERLGVDADRAFDMLSRISQDTNTPVSVVSARVIATRGPNDLPAGPAGRTAIRSADNKPRAR